MSASREMPKYRCHKEVWALKIAEIRQVLPPRFQRAVCRGSYRLGSACGHCERCRWEGENTLAWAHKELIPVDLSYGPIRVDAKYVAKHDPQPGGYYVVYEDGYQSFSPAEGESCGLLKGPRGLS